MTTSLSASNPTLLDVTKRLDPNGNIDSVAELLAQRNEILEDMTFVEGNLPTGHRSTVRTGLPTATWRKWYGGVVPGKSLTAQVTDDTAMLEQYAEIDKALADLNGNTAAWRLSEEKAFIEAMNQEFASTLFYGDHGSAPEEFNGLMMRYNSTSAENAINLIAGGAAAGQTDCTSIWLVIWSPETIFGIYPKGSKAGLQIEDKGQVTLGDSTNGYYEGYRSHYKWDVGLVCKDWRFAARVHSLDVSTLTKATTGTNDSDLTDLMVQMLEAVPDLRAGRPVFYCNRTIKAMLRRQITAKIGSSTLSMDNIAGKHVLTFDGIPVKRCDSILNTESSLN
jgi:hypothetical protein